MQLLDAVQPDSGTYGFPPTHPPASHGAHTVTPGPRVTCWKTALCSCWMQGGLKRQFNMHPQGHPPTHPPTHLNQQSALHLGGLRAVATWFILLNASQPLPGTPGGRKQLLDARQP